MSKSKVLAEPDWGRVDAVVYKWMGLKPVKEISEIAGVEPAVVLRRYHELLESIDVLTVQQKRVRLLMELEGMARDARSRAEGADSEYASGLWNSATSAIKTMLVELARLERGSDDAVERLNQLRVRELMNIVQSSVLLTVSDIAKRWDLDEAEVSGMFQERLTEVARLHDSGMEGVG